MCVNYATFNKCAQLGIIVLIDDNLQLTIKMMKLATCNICCLSQEVLQLQALKNNKVCTVAIHHVLLQLVIKLMTFQVFDLFTDSTVQLANVF